MSAVPGSQEDIAFFEDQPFSSQGNAGQAVVARTHLTGMVIPAGVLHMILRPVAHKTSIALEKVQQTLCTL